MENRKLTLDGEKVLSILLVITGGLFVYLSLQPPGQNFLMVIFPDVWMVLALSFVGGGMFMLLYDQKKLLLLMDLGMMISLLWILLYPLGIPKIAGIECSVLSSTTVMMAAMITIAAYRLILDKRNEKWYDPLLMFFLSLSYSVGFLSAAVMIIHYT